MRLVSIVNLCLLLTRIYAQNPNPKVAPFNGQVYLIPDEKKTTGYGTYLDSLNPVQEVTYKNLNIPDRMIDEEFPGVSYRYGFGMILNSTMKIDTPGYYYFNLISDDGSRLWINDMEIINNDGDHRMIMKSDTILLDKGVHDIRLWYYQAFALNYGLIFETGFYDYYDGILPPHQETLIIKDILFEHDSYQLTASSVIFLDSIFSNFSCDKVHKIEIIGHTDGRGSITYNKKLSQLRSGKVLDVIKKYCPETAIYSLGRGEEDPITTNENEYSRRQNRRVEIILHPNPLQQ